MTTTKRTDISAILGEEFYALINALGIRDSFDRGEYVCDQCHVVVDSTNVLLVFPQSGHRVAFLCTYPTCAVKYKTTP